MNAQAETSFAQLVTTGWLADHLDDPDIRIVDCSVTKVDYDGGGYGFVPGREDWERGHIPRAVFVDVMHELSDPDSEFSLMMPPPERFAAVMGELGIGAGTRAILYDRGNHAWAARVWWMLRVCGFDTAAVLNGGFTKWRDEGQAVSTDTRAYPPARFEIEHRPQLMATKQDVLAALNEADICLIYALPPAVHSGEVQLFSRPGRIPGSHNVYCDSLIDPATKAFHEPAVLRERFTSCGALQARQVITYCGGGIAASSDALALVLLGHENVAVYDGSMNEWTADPGTPLEV